MELLDSNLMQAVVNGDVEEVKEWIKRGANINAKHYMDSNTKRCKNITVLHEAVKHGYTEIVKILIDAKPDINAADYNGYTALHWAALKGNTEFAELLIKAEAYVNAVDNDGKTALHWAAEKEYTEFSKVLIENGANPDIKTHEGNTVWDVIKGKKRMELVFTKALEKWHEKQ